MSAGRIVSFRDLEVFQSTYRASLDVMTHIVPKLPQREQFDLGSQLSRSCKAIPRLIAEGYAKRHQRLGFRKYLDDAMAEANEMVVSLEHCRDLYAALFPCVEFNRLIDTYDKAGRQLYRLHAAWNYFRDRRGPTSPKDETGRVTGGRST